ncbi:MAG TPA: POTRA domain-containing protein [Bryobacteraceae bacterium]|nr:POTRA domain-containing protein [Bryobacteraceae bacterium]
MRWRLSLAVLAAVVYASSALAQVSPFEGKRIVDIAFTPELVLHPADVEKILPFKVGSSLRREEVAVAIDRLFATGRFEDVVVEAESKEDGVAVRFVTRIAWFIGGVSVAGKVVNPPNRGQIANTAQLNLGAPFREEELSQSKQSIQDLLKANGLYESEVTPKTERKDAAQQVFISFHIAPHKRAKYQLPVIQGETRLSESTIVKATGWRVPIVHWWKHVTDSRTRNGLQGILSRYQKDNRLMARVELQKLDYDAAKRRVTPHLHITSGPKVEIKAVEAKVSKRVLKRYVPVFQEQTVDNDLLTEGKRNLRDYFQSKGYYDADVDFRMPAPQNDRQPIEYVISQGQRYKVVDISITGNRYFSTPDIRERMFMQPASFSLRRGRYSEAFRRKDEENIGNLYRSNGFRDVRVNSIVDHQHQGKNGQIGVNVVIEEGPQWLVENVTVNGIQQVDRDVIVSRLASLSGQPFSDVNMASDRNMMLTYYYSLGFPAATLQTAWEPSALPNRVNVTYTVNEGDRQYVRDIITSGLRTTRQRVVNKHMTLRPGDPLSPIEQVDIQRRFYDLGVFARVDTAIENPDGITSHKYVLYHFEEAHRYTLGLGVGAQLGRFGTPSTTTLSSPAGSTGFSPAFSVDASRLNFLGIGHTVSLRGIASNLEQRASLSYFAPRFRNVDGRNITFTALYENSLNVRTFASKRQEVSIQASQQFSKPTTGLFRFAYRRVSVGRVVIPVLLVPQLLQPVRIGMLSANIAQDRRDNPSDPRRGIYNTADLGLSTKFFGSQRSFTRVLVRNATYHRITNSTVLARQTQFGMINPFSAPPGLPEAQSIPLPERFFGGGADSLRAFPFNQAGPRDIGQAVTPGGPTSQPTGFPLGGNALFFNNVEWRFPLIGANIQGVLFHDMGNVFSTLGNISFRFRQNGVENFDYTVQAVGFGVRYRTPVGPVRVDLAYSINPPSYIGFKGTPSELLQCNPGLAQLPGFCQGAKQTVSHLQFFFSIGQTF